MTRTLKEPMVSLSISTTGFDESSDIVARFAKDTSQLFQSLLQSIMITAPERSEDYFVRSVTVELSDGTAITRYSPPPQDT